MKAITIILCFTLCFKAQAQYRFDSNAVKHMIDSVNRLLDNAVVNKQYDVLQKHYAEDFYFKHSTGQIDSKKSWIDGIMKPSATYTSRTHDSVVVELHKNIAIVTGTLKVHRKDQGKITGYALTYFRVFVWRNKVWQLLSHNSILEWKID